MAVSSLQTTIVNFEAAPTFVNYGGGAGASLNTDIFIQGAQSAGRRADNVTASGFGVSFGAVDLSAANQHIKIWTWVTQWASVTKLVARIADTTNDDDHTLPTAEYPNLGGWIPFWVDVSRTPETGGSANEAAIVEAGVLVDIGNVGGNAQNLIIDEISYGTSGLLWTGSSGTLTSFQSYEVTNRVGALVTNAGVAFCFARLQIGSAVATTFTDSGFQLVFPDQALVSSDFMGVTIDLQNASTAVTLSSASISSGNVAAASRRPDFVVSGTAGTLSLTSMRFSGMRLISLTSAVTVSGGALGSVAIVQGGAHLSGCAISTRSASGVACITDPAFGASSGIHDADFQQVGSGHAVEIASVGTYTFSNLTFSGYGADASNSAAVYVSAPSGTVTINLTGTTQPTYRTAGATVQFVASYTLTLTGVPNGVQVTIVNSSTRTELQNVVSSGADISYAHSGGETVDIMFMSNAYDPNVSDIFDLTLPTADTSIPINLLSDPNYVNP